MEPTVVFDLPEGLLLGPFRLAVTVVRRVRCVLGIWFVEAGLGEHAKRADPDEVVHAGVSGERRKIPGAIDVHRVQGRSFGEVIEQRAQVEDGVVVPVLEEGFERLRPGQVGRDEGTASLLGRRGAVNGVGRVVGLRVKPLSVALLEVRPHDLPPTGRQSIAKMRPREPTGTRHERRLRHTNVGPGER